MSRASLRTRLRVAADTRPVPFNAFEAVEGETLAAAATLSRVTRTMPAIVINFTTVSTHTLIHRKTISDGSTFAVFQELNQLIGHPLSHVCHMMHSLPHIFRARKPTDDD